MKIIIFTIFATLVLLISCQKPEGDDLSGTNELSGTVKITDSLRGLSDTTSLSNQLVKISYWGDEFRNNFIYSVITKGNGSFSFTNLSQRDYIIFAEARVNNLDFYASAKVNPVSAKNADLLLEPDTSKKNIVVIQSKDAQTRGPLNGSKICLFSNAILANANECDGSFLTLTTDQYGRTYTTGLKPGKYYLNAQLTSGSVTLKGKDSIEIIRTTGISSMVLLLK
jgi:uncharacterized surface anchored protein